MTKILPFFLFLIIGIELIYSQTTTQKNFVVDGSYWYFSKPHIGGSPLHDFTLYEYTKDSLVQGKTCHFICSSRDDSQLFYEEDDRVFYYASEKFNLLYDFGVKENDTIFLDIWAETFILDEEDNIVLIDTILPVESVVTGIDSILAEDYYFKIVSVDIFPEADFLENSTWPSSFEYHQFFGYTHDGLIPKIIEGNGPAIQKNRNLRCYKDSRVYFVNDYWQQFELSCDYKEPDEIYAPNTKQFLVFPNPAESYLKVEFGEVPDNFVFKIIDISGHIIITGNISIENPEISLHGIKKGIYFLHVENSSGSYSKGIKIMRN